MISFYPQNYVNFQGGLKKNLRKSECALSEYKREYPYINSSTLIWQRTENIERKRKISLPYLWDFKKKIQVDIIKKRMDNYPLFRTDYDEYLENVKKIMKNERIGNCGECVDIMREYLKKDFPDVKAVELVMVNERKDHAFCVVGMNPGADIKRPSTWGNKAVVVDSWRNIALSVPDAIREYEKLFDIEYSENSRSCYFEEIDYYD